MSADPQITGPPPGASTLRLMWLSLLAVSSQATIAMCSWGIGAILPELANSFHLSGRGIGVVVAAGSLGTALTLVPAGAVVDAIGPRVPLLVGAVTASVALAGAARASSVLWLTIAFATFGAASSLVVMAGAVALFATVPANRRGLTMGLRQMSIALGGLLAAVLLAPLIDARGVGFGLTAAAVAVLISSTAFAIWAGGPVRGRRHPMRINVPALVAVPGMLRLLLVGCLFAIALTCVLSFATPALRAAGGTLAQTSKLFMVISLAAMAARVLWGRMADRGGPGALHRWQTLQLIGITTCVGALGYWLADRNSAGSAIQLAAMAVFAFGALGANGVIHLTGGELAGPARAGEAMGLTQTVLFGVNGLSAPMLGAIADARGYLALWVIAAGAGAIAAFLAKP